jgi:heat shock protein HslJ
MQKVILLLGLGILFVGISCSTAKQKTGNASLSGKWELQKIGGTRINSSNQERGVPTLELNLAEGRVSGFGGCNRYFGSVFTAGNTLVFGALASTKMACLGPNVEEQFLLALSKEKLPYRTSEGILYLGEGPGTLVFKKEDSER